MDTSETVERIERPGIVAQPMSLWEKVALGLGMKQKLVKSQTEVLKSETELAEALRNRELAVNTVTSKNLSEEKSTYDATLVDGRKQAEFEANQQAQLREQEATHELELREKEHVTESLRADLEQENLKKQIKEVNNPPPPQLPSKPSEGERAMEKTRLFTKRQVAIITSYDKEIEGIQRRQDLSEKQKKLLVAQLEHRRDTELDRLRR